MGVCQSSVAVVVSRAEQRIANYAAAAMPTHSSRVELFRFAAFDVEFRGAYRPRLEQPARTSCGIYRSQRRTRPRFYRPVVMISTVSGRSPAVPVRRHVTAEPVLTRGWPLRVPPECSEAGGENGGAGSGRNVTPPSRSVKKLPGGLAEKSGPRKARKARSDAGRQPVRTSDSRSSIVGQYPSQNERRQQNGPARTIRIRNQLQRRLAVPTHVP